MPHPCTKKPTGSSLTALNDLGPGLLRPILVNPRRRLKASLRRARAWCSSDQSHYKPRRPHPGGLHGWGASRGSPKKGAARSCSKSTSPSLKQTCVIHRRLLKGSPRDNGAGRISKHWVQKFLQHTHDEEVGQGISVLVARLSEDQAAALNAWDGEVTDEGAKPSKAWQGRLYREILPHADAYLREEAEMSDDFMTPPKPKVELEEGAGPAIPPFPDLDDSDRQGRMEAARRALDQHIEGEIDSEVLQTVATAFDLDHEQLAQSMYARNHRLSYSKPTTPPGLGADQSEMEFARRPVTATMPGGVTVKPAVPRPANPLLPRSSSSISPVQRGGLSLFPRGQAVETVS